MTSTIKNLNYKITTNLASVTCEKSIGQLAGAVDAVNSTTIDCVASAASLPTASENTGRFIGVGTSNALCYRYSNGAEWKCDYDTTTGIAKKELWMWGYNANGEIGNSNTTNQFSPIMTCGGGFNWCTISGGNTITAGIKTDGTLWVWGQGVWGALGTGFTTSYSSPVTVAGGGTNWKSVSGGYLGTIGLKQDGTLWVWGTTCSYSGNYLSPSTIVGGGNTWCFATLGGYNIAGIKTDGTLWVSGQNTYGQLGTNNTTATNSPVTTVAGGTTWCTAASSKEFAFSIKTDGTLWAMGRNNSGQLGTGDITNYSSPVTTAGGGTNWCQVSVGCNHTHALKTDGTLWSWGDNSSTQLGTNDTTNYSSPVTISGGGTNWCQVSAGCFNGGAIKTDGTLWGWSQAFGNATACSPVTIIGGGNTWCQVDIGRYHYAAIKLAYKGF